MAWNIEVGLRMYENDTLMNEMNIFMRHRNVLISFNIMKYSFQSVVYNSEKNLQISEYAPTLIADLNAP